VVAAEVRAGGAQLVPQPVYERQARLHLREALLAVHLEFDDVQLRAHAAFAFACAACSTRAASTPARSRRYSALACRSLPGSDSSAARFAISRTRSFSNAEPTRRA